MRPRDLTRPSRRTVSAVFAATVIAVVSFALGRATGDDVTWHSGTAVLGGGESSPKFSALLAPDDPWTYGAKGSVPRWTDAEGVSHSGGWPDCLMPPTDEHPERAQVVPVRFATVDVDEGEIGRGPRVVAVDCRY